MKKINVAIIGVGSLAKALVEGVSFYTKHPDEIIGLQHSVIGAYKVGDINFVCAFDVDERKVGKKLHQAISMGSNVTQEITQPLAYDAVVYRGPTFDGVIDQMKGTFVEESKLPVVNVADVLKNAKTDVVVNLIPTGSDQATQFYAQASLEAGCSFINCIPTPLATINDWRKKFEEKGLVLLGDDIKSQLGATMLNRSLLELLKMRGITVTHSSQENEGGNADHFNLLYRSSAKQTSKSKALAPFLKTSTVPSVTFSYTGKLSGHKKVTINLEGEMFGRVPIHITSVIEDEISINGAGTIVDAIRMAQFLIDTQRQNKAEDVCGFLMKSSTKQMSDRDALEVFNRII